MSTNGAAECSYHDRENPGMAGAIPEEEYTMKGMVFHDPCNHVVF